MWEGLTNRECVVCFISLQERYVLSHSPACKCNAHEEKLQGPAEVESVNSVADAERLRHRHRAAHYVLSPCPCRLITLSIPMRLCEGGTQGFVLGRRNSVWRSLGTVSPSNTQLIPMRYSIYLITYQLLRRKSSMSRCKACDTPLSNKHTPVYNKLSKQEEDLCTICIRYSRVTELPHEYLFGLHPSEGLTQPSHSVD